MKTESLLSKVLCVLMLCTVYVIYGCTEDPIDKGDGTEQEGDKNGNEEGNGKEDEGYEDMGTAAYRIDEFSATTATFTGHLKVPASELQFFSQVTVYYTSDDVFNFDTAESVSTTSFGPDQDFKVVLKELLFDTKYKYCILTDVKSGKTYSNS